MRNLSYENEFYSQVHSNANHTHFHMKDFALELGLKQRQKATRKWPIVADGENDEIRLIRKKDSILQPFNNAPRVQGNILYSLKKWPVLAVVIQHQNEMAC